LLILSKVVSSLKIQECSSER